MARRGDGLTIAARGKTLTIIQWATWLGWDPLAIRARLRAGWDPVRAVTEPPRKVDRAGEMDPRDRRREKVREQRRQRAEAGLCIHCGIMAEPGKTQCASHLRKAAEAMRGLQQTRREIGMCVRCDEPAQPGFSTCTEHGEYNAELTADRRALKVATGECLRYKRKAQAGHQLCRSHVAADRREFVLEKPSREARRLTNRVEWEREKRCMICGSVRVKRRTLCAEHAAKLDALDRATEKRREKAKLIVRPGVIRRKKPV